MRHCARSGTAPPPCSGRKLRESREKRLCTLGCFVARKDGCRSTGNIPIPRSKYEENGYKPDFDKLPSDAEYLAAQKKKEDDAPRP